MDSCIISFNLNCIMQLKQFYDIHDVALKVSSRKKCHYFWWSTRLLVPWLLESPGDVIRSNVSNESNFIAMNYIDHIIGDVQASSWIRNELAFVYIYLHSGIVSTLFSRISMYDTKNKIIMHYSSPTMQFLNSWQRGQEAWAYGPQYLLKWSST